MSARGSTGATGPRGFRGDKGKTGTTGTRGTQGERGKLSTQQDARNRHRVITLSLVTFAWLAIVVAFVLIYVVNGRSTKADNRTVAAANATYVSCVTAIPLLKKVELHLDGSVRLANVVGGLANVLAENSAAVLATTPKSDPSYKSRQEGLARIVNAQNRTAVAKFEISAIGKLGIPDKADCLEQRQAVLSGKVQLPPATPPKPKASTKAKKKQ